jgi:hypothetical protein
VVGVVRRTLGALRRFVPYGRRPALSVEAGVATVARARPARLVAVGGGSTRPVQGWHAKPSHATPAHAQGRLATLYCPGCGTHLARGELAPRLVTRCPGCDRRVAMRLDGVRVVVALEG